MLPLRRPPVEAPHRLANASTAQLLHCQIHSAQMLHVAFYLCSETIQMIMILRLSTIEPLHTHRHLAHQSRGLVLSIPCSSTARLIVASLCLFAVERSGLPSLMQP